ncbi:ATP-binding protein [Kitasatospora kifunensis]|uniref:Anti-sigma regulatory factor (Ser/Thr protein kinase) n=1 Tax=Kitasatospora kifunensis TaxID=58351 RepID=A0A7W7QWP8_KITKI|nr:ATP-binding protein [Kitasatospora kifunensis]MBB4921168.1 anti-sigma regulatory factor (Ser/Thr protein kinase) [Kitasatospora kifunensis]
MPNTPSPKPPHDLDVDHDERDASWKVLADLAEVGPTRRLAVGLVREWVPDVPDEATESVRRVVGELVTNAIQHGGGNITVHMWITPGHNVAIVVCDGSPALPTPREPYDDGTRGRGLAVVQAETLSLTWSPEKGGKTVRATIALPSSRSDQPHTRLLSPPRAPHSRLHPPTLVSACAH